jgi:hypothetical protein
LTLGEAANALAPTFMEPPPPKKRK